MRFLADMGISPKTVAFLRDLGHDAVHLHALGMDRLPDPAILELARAENRILLTHDLDFGELIAAGGEAVPSVIVFRLRRMEPQSVNHHLQGVMAQHQESLERGAIVSVVEGQARVRSLSIGGEEPK
jgi:predicted nuclease of predicted toxin-antitoxin system